MTRPTMPDMGELWDSVENVADRIEHLGDSISGLGGDLKKLVSKGRVLVGR